MTCNLTRPWLPTRRCIKTFGGRPVSNLWWATEVTGGRTRPWLAEEAEYPDRRLSRERENAGMHPSPWSYLPKTRTPYRVASAPARLWDPLPRYRDDRGSSAIPQSLPHTGVRPPRPRPAHRRT